MSRIAVLGSGAMGTACAVLLCEQPELKVSLWGANSAHVNEIAHLRENRRLLPGIPIPEVLHVEANIDQALEGAEFLVIAIPTRYLRSALEQIAISLRGDQPAISVVKGIELETLLRPSEIIEDVLGPRTVIALSGPSHAEEFARRLPASVVAASGDVLAAREVQKLFNTDRFRVYTNSDLLGVELAGAIKNVVAIAAGICDGMKYGDNAKSALVTRGLVEMTRFGVAMGAEASTFSGLAGMGDLITTCFSPYGRNRRVGERLGQGETLEQILATMDSVAEGVTTARSLHDLAVQRGIEMPITKEIYEVLFEGKSVLEATNSLMDREPKAE